MIYSFQHNKTKEILTLEMRMDDREPWLVKHKQWSQIIVNMTLADPMMLGIQTKDQKEFNKHVLGRMQKSIPGNILHRSRYNQNIMEI